MNKGDLDAIMALWTPDPPRSPAGKRSSFKALPDQEVDGRVRMGLGASGGGQTIHGCSGPIVRRGEIRKKTVKFTLPPSGIAPRGWRRPGEMA
jgi:hypothetical protein